MLNQGQNLKQTGAVALFLTVILLAGLLIIGLAVSLIMLSEIKLSRATGNSVVAYYAAESGAEMMTYNIYAGYWEWSVRRGCPTDPECYNEPTCIQEPICCQHDIDPTDANFNPSYMVRYNGYEADVGIIESNGFYNQAARSISISF